MHARKVSNLAKLLFNDGSNWRRSSPKPLAHIQCAAEEKVDFWSNNVWQLLHMTALVNCHSMSQRLRSYTSTKKPWTEQLLRSKRFSGDSDLAKVEPIRDHPVLTFAL